MSEPISRIEFLRRLTRLGLGAYGLSQLSACSDAYSRAPVRWLGPSRQFAHSLRDDAHKPKIAQASSLPTKTLVIMGGGIAGLSAGWWLKRQGFTDFHILELEDNVGGNSASGKNKVSAFPWGAHYIPIPNAESDYVHLLFAEMNIIESRDKNGRPKYNELYLCHEPQERLYKDGTFQDGLVPKRGLQENEKLEMKRFFEAMAQFRQARGTDGKPAFSIPLAKSSLDPLFISLDSMSMAQWLRENGFNSKALKWYIDYCCRDDYGSLAENVSAWAGIHYFAGRRGQATNAEMNAVLTWPEGNGFVVNYLKRLLADHIMAKTAVCKIVQAKDKLKLYYQVNDPSKRGQTYNLDCRHLIYAAPRFSARYVIADYPKERAELECKMQYAPWLVANITLKQVPDARGEFIAWDNVRYNGDSLGYVVATHQSMSTRQGQTVITYYRPLSDLKPEAGRKELMKEDKDNWLKLIVADLEKMHPGLSNEFLSIDLWPWGHGMVSPAVGFIWGPERKSLLEDLPKIIFAHSDMSGISNFEEAQYQGVEAAKRLLAKGIRR